MIRCCFVIFLLCFLARQSAYPQIKLTVGQCEEAFRRNNSQLLAEQLNIDLAKAQAIQAQIWDLPVASVELNAINPEQKKILSIGGAGQKGLAVEQLIYLGGKKKNEVEFAKSNISIAELTYEQILRNLRFQVKQSYYTLYFDYLKIANISNKVANIDSLVASYSVQANRGNVPLKDLVRLQSLALNLKKQLAEARSNIIHEQESLKIITGIQQDIQPVIDEAEISSVLSKSLPFNLDYLQNLALEKNPEVLIFNKIIESNELFYKWQQSLAKPDVSLGFSYDQRGGAFQNQINFTASMPIALWNRNKGNIQSANIQILQSQNLKKQKEVELKSNVESALKELLHLQNLYKTVSDNSVQNFEIVYNGVIANFQKRNISLIEFTDIIESYIESTVLINDIKKDVIVSGASLNHLVNENVF